MALNLKTETVFTDDTPAAQPPLPPEQIAPHFPQLEILECLGRGGMGVVYKARQKCLNRFVALKLLAPERVNDAKFAERFTREAQALAALNHPNIVTIHDFGQAGGFYYLLMEFVDGLNLRQLLRTRKFTPEEALAIVPPLCDALQFAHDRGIVHRDIKPENLLLDNVGRVKVADFGIAKMLGTGNGAKPGESVAPESTTQSTVGTPGYSAPEQKTDPQRVDSRADIYSLGVVFYEMLTGELPGKKIAPPSTKVQIDVRLDEVVLRALQKKPELRYQQVSEVKTMVETIVATPPGSDRPEAQTEKSNATVDKNQSLVTSAPTKGHSAPPPSPKPDRFWRIFAVAVFALISIPFLIAILGLLAAIAIPNFVKGRVKAQENARHAGQMPPTAPHPEPNAIREISGAPFVARLPEGGSLELLAVRIYPQTNQPWWQPDGLPSIYDAAIEAETKEPAGRGVVALVRIKYPTTHVKWPLPAGGKNSVGIDLANGPGFAVKDGRRLLEPDDPNSPGFTMFGVMDFKEPLADTNATTLPVKLATGEWRTLIAQKPGWLVSLLDSPARKEWKFSETPDGALKVTITHFVENAEMEYRLIAVDTDGTQYLPSMAQRTKRADEPSATLEATFAPPTGSGDRWQLPLNRVREVRLEARPYEQIEFRNVSLQPGHKTTVTVKDFGDTQASPPEAQSLSFDAFVERVRRELARASIRFDKLHISAVNDANFIVSFSGLEAHGVLNGKDAWLPIPSAGGLAAKRGFFGGDWEFKGLDQLAVVHFSAANLDLDKLLETNLAEALPAAPAAAPNLSPGQNAGNSVDWLKIQLLDGWISDLQSPDSKTQKIAERALTDLGTNALSKLVEILNDSTDQSMKNQNRHLNAAQALRFMGPGVKSGLPAFTAMLKSGQQETAYSGARALAYSAPMAPEAFSILTNGLTDSVTSVRDAATDGAGFCLQLESNRFAEAALPLLVNNVNDPVDYVRSDTAVALMMYTQHQCQRGVPVPDFLISPLVGLLHDKSRYARGYALAALDCSCLKDQVKPWLPAIQKLVDDPDAFVRQSATNLVRSLQ